MKIVICEDEKYWSEKLKIAVSKWATKREIIIHCKIVTMPHELIYYLNNNDVDVLFIDISLGEKVIDGIALAKYIRKTGNTVPMLFVTSNTFRAADGYLVEAMGYLTKPIEENKLALFLDRVVKRKRGFKTIDIISGGQITKINQRNIIYIEIIDHTVEYHTTQGILSQRGRLSEVLSRLDENSFIQIHRSYVISIEKINVIKSTYPYLVILNSKSELIELPVSRKYINNLLEMYSDDLLEMMI